jgi:hypothetical protein
VVRSAPTGAGVIVNGTWRGRTPLTLENLPFRGYSVRVTQPGFLGDNERITLDADEPTREVTLRLRPQPKAVPTPAAPAPAAAGRSSAPTTFTGAIFIDSRPQGARVSIDGKPVGVTPLRVPGVRIGTRIVRLELPDHRIWSSTARVTAGQESKVTGSLERIQ